MNRLWLRPFFLMLLFYAFEGYAEKWPAWEFFKKNYIFDGRVIDTSTTQKITTSEGQSYAMFFALCANDRKTFDELFQWTNHYLANDHLENTIPSWLWGKKKDASWGVLDENFASDSALWIAYDLLEASRLWHKPQYKVTAMGLLNSLLHHAVDMKGLGPLILPGGYGFDFQSHFRLNPSYYPPQLMRRFAMVNPNFANISSASLKLIMQSSPYGMAADWVIWRANKGWQADFNEPNQGSYDAIRVYLWVGMLPEGPLKKRLRHHFMPMLQWVKKHGFVPEKINVITHAHQGKGPIGFDAALRPLQANPWQHSMPFLQRNSYYNSVLILFSEGWLSSRFQFDETGKLILATQGALHEKSH